MTDEPILLTPGPTPVPPEVREVMARPIPHHRTPEFQRILKEVAAELKTIFGTAQEVLLLTSSGTGAMEAAVTNLLSPKDQAIVVRGGKFGERWAELCEAHGISVIPIDPPWGKPLGKEHGDQIQTALKRERRIKAVFTTLCETSTGVRFDVREIAERVHRESDALVVVDAVSGLMADPFAMDAWGIDVAVAGSQKGLMLPPGLSFIALSDRAWAAVPKSQCSKYYFDLTLARQAWADGDTPFTPAISLIMGLAESLRMIKALRPDRIIATHEAHAEMVREKIRALGLELYTDSSCASNAVTAVKVPPGIDGKEILKRLKTEHGIVLAGGQGKELAGRIFRIATMGAIGAEEIHRALAALEQVLTEMGWKVPTVTHG